MFTPKTALFTFVAACTIGVVACQPVDASDAAPTLGAPTTVAASDAAGPGAAAQPAAATATAGR